MFLRHRKKPLPLQHLEALVSRLSPHHPQLKILQEEVAKRRKGYYGERKLDYHLESLSDDFSILSDVCFSLYGQQTQMDSLIISGHAIFIIEVKSFEGIVTFDTELRQCYRNVDGNIEGYNYPITQVQRIHANVLRFLQLAKLSGLPIYYFVVFSERSTHIKVKGEEVSIKDIVTYVEEVPFKIMEINHQLAAKNG